MLLSLEQRELILTQRRVSLTTRRALRKDTPSDMVISMMPIPVPAKRQPQPLLTTSNSQGELYTTTTLLATLGSEALRTN
jgi:hypothetical protein